MIKVPIERAIGKPLAHDITRIVPKESKGPAFRRGHIVTVEDLPALRDLGKTLVFVFDPDSGYIHEDEAAKVLAEAFQKRWFTLEGPSEGRVNLRAQIKGLLKVNTSLLKFINQCESIICSTVHQDTVCPKGMVVAVTRIIPVSIGESRFWPLVKEIKREGPLLNLLPFSKKNVGVVVTGQEISSGRIKDCSLEILSPKVQSLGGKIVSHQICPDQKGIISRAISNMAERGCDIIITTGGLSVDADDVTLDGILHSGAELVSYGSPILPGAMFALAYLGDIPVLGIPACLFSCKTTVLDIFLPRAMCGDRITKEEIVSLGHGGLCLQCPDCRYPVCSFGKGA